MEYSILQWHSNFLDFFFGRFILELIPTAGFPCEPGISEGNACRFSKFDKVKLD